MRASPSSIDRAVGTEIAAARKRRGLSQELLAEGAGLSRNHVSLIETGASSPTVRVLFQLAAALATTPADLLRGVGVGTSRPGSKRRQ